VVLHSFSPPSTSGCGVGLVCWQALTGRRSFGGPSAASPPIGDHRHSLPAVQRSPVQDSPVELSSSPGLPRRLIPMITPSPSPNIPDQSVFFAAPSPIEQPPTQAGIAAGKRLSTIKANSSSTEGAGSTNVTPTRPNSRISGGSQPKDSPNRAHRLPLHKRDKSEPASNPRHSLATSTPPPSLSTSVDSGLPSDRFDVSTATLLQLFVKHAALSHKANFFGFHTLSEEERSLWLEVVLTAEELTGFPVRNSMLAHVARALGLADPSIKLDHTSRQMKLRSTFEELQPGLLKMEAAKRAEKKRMEEATGARQHDKKNAYGHIQYVDIASGEVLRVSEYEERYMEDVENVRKASDWTDAQNGEEIVDQSASCVGVRVL
jgi:hypothetical protein